MLENLPALDALADLSDDAREALRSRLDAEMRQAALQYRATQIAAEAAVQQKADALKEWERENAALIENELTFKAQEEAEKAALHNAVILWRQLTGEATHHACQAAEVWKPEYDAEALKLWALDHAPRTVRLLLLRLDATAANSLVLNRRDEWGVPRPYEGCDPLPALARKSYQGRVLKKELDALIAAPPYTPPAAAAVLLTQDFVAEQTAEPA